MIDQIAGATAKLGLMALDAYTERHRVLAHNIANIDSEGYRPLRLDFEEQLQKLQQAVNSGASDAELSALADAVHPFAEVSEAISGPLPDSSQRLDDEMALLVQNTLQYQAVLTSLNHRGSLMRIAITGEP